MHGCATTMGSYGGTCRQAPCPQPEESSEPACSGVATHVSGKETFNFVVHRSNRARRIHSMRKKVCGGFYNHAARTPVPRTYAGRAIQRSPSDMETRSGTALARCYSSLTKEYVMLKFLGFLFGVVLVVGLIGWSAGWWRVTSETHAGGKGVNVEVDRGEIEKDLGNAKDTVKSTAEDLASTVEQQFNRMSGSVDAVEVGSFRVTASDGTMRSFLIDAETRVEQNDVVTSVSAIDVGDRLSLSYIERGGKYIARKVELGTSD